LLAYVHLAKLFLDQKGVPRRHLVNVNSIAGHCACQANTDYCASKYGILGFTDALRHELDHYNKEGEDIKMTNFYPYYVNTGLFKGFNPLLGYIMPMLK
jgi:all-trans-retinol dehydrogenase (NAD+)